MIANQENPAESGDQIDRAAQDLRQRAEKQARETGAEESMLLSAMESSRLVHELRVHQIELEMQNEELRRTQAALEISHERLHDLYEQAPVGYVTLAEDGMILDGNQTAAAFLEISQDNLVRRHLTDFIAPQDQDTYYLAQRKLFKTGECQAFELHILHANGTFWWARVETRLAEDRCQRGKNLPGGDQQRQ